MLIYYAIVNLRHTSNQCNVQSQIHNNAQLEFPGRTK